MAPLVQVTAWYWKSDKPEAMVSKFYDNIMCFHIMVSLGHGDVHDW